MESQGLDSSTNTKSDGEIGVELAKYGAKSMTDQEQYQPLIGQQEESPGGEIEDPLPTSLLKFLYIGHFLSRWSARLWEFTVALYMVNIWSDSLLLTAIYGVVESASVALFGPVVGQWVDKLSYVKVLRIWSLTQNLSFVVAGGTVIALLSNSSLRFENLKAFVSLVVVTNLSGAIGMLSTLAGTILIEREW